jgi:hypothetical protein
MQPKVGRSGHFYKRLSPHNDYESGWMAGMTLGVLRARNLKTKENEEVGQAMAQDVLALHHVRPWA